MLSITKNIVAERNNLRGLLETDGARRVAEHRTLTPGARDVGVLTVRAEVCLRRNTILANCTSCTV
jgi:hypothetical protein